MLHYICDFASHCARLVIEVDGGQHGDVSDAARTHAIETQGYRVLRFWNNEVLGNLEGVYHTLAKVLHEIDAGIDGFGNRVSSEGGRHINDRSVGSGFS